MIVKNICKLSAVISVCVFVALSAAFNHTGCPAGDQIWLNLNLFFKDNVLDLGSCPPAAP